MTGRIELTTGPDRCYRCACWLVWLLALAATAAKAPEMHWGVILLALSVLIVLRPFCSRWLRETDSLWLHADGRATLSRGGHKLAGQWRIPTRPSRWLTVVPLETGTRVERLLVCSSRNRADDYRHLLMWTRFPPFGNHGRAAGTCEE